MTKNKLLLISVLCLLLLNLGTLSFIYFQNKETPNRHQRHHHPKKPDALIIDRLNFDADQIKQYRILIKKHRMEIDQLEQGRKKLKSQLYVLLLEENQEQQKNIVNQLATLQKKIEFIHFNHFRDIKEICKPDQLEDFKRLSLELSNIFGGRPRRHH